MKRILFFCGVIGSLSSCSDTFLDAKPNSNIVTPTTMEDCRRLLDNDGRGEGGLNLWFPSLGQLASDEHYYDFETWQSTVFARERTSYIWADDIYEGLQNVSDWDDAYRAIYICNVVLNVLNEISVNGGNQKEYNDIKGTALFFRAMWYHALAEIFCMPYNGSADQTLGLPLRTTPNVDELKQRATLGETFALILADLNKATELLAGETPTQYRNRPSKCAAHALLARIHLVRGDYELALVNANRSLELYNELLDYNDLTLEGDAVFDRNNPEVILMAQIRGVPSIAAGSVAATSFVDSTLIGLYKPGDLRLQAYFTFNEHGQANRKSLYTTSFSSVNCFNGLSTDEVVLIKAECLARAGDLHQAAAMLDMLLSKRMVNGTFETSSFGDESSALQEILNERRKELLFRGLRWSDVRRLNAEDFEIEQRRVLNDQVFVLEPNSPKYAFPIPDSEILFSHIIQNPR